MTIKSLPAESRPREKLLSHGAQSLTDAELLAIFLRTGVKGMSVLKLADKLIKEFGSLRKLFLSSEAEFCRHRGLGMAKYVQLQAVIEMTSRYLSETLRKGDIMESPSHTRSYLSNRLRDKEREAFLVLYLDNQHRVIADEILFEGTINSASIYPREVVKQALFYNAAAVIVAHNHPSGVAEPSLSDKNITHRISDALGMVDIKLLDHFIIGDGSITSFAERGWI